MRMISEVYAPGMGEIRNAYKRLFGKLERKRPLEDPGLEEKIILKWFLKKQGARVLPGLIWLGMRTNSRLLRTLKLKFWFQNCGERLLATISDYQRLLATISDYQRLLATISFQKRNMVHGVSKLVRRGKSVGYGNSDPFNKMTIW
jgi:hypothetical protein